ncbi:hypothetical protein Goari_019432 [Gossypium aridum]|uniref:Uncharacterized protein n=1 Tax=Gossypium aridum TaxID=34290 RepID=A0A7J8WSU2_GOSAI|nr:hypothetical protein [Gossypium aridum]
MENYFRAKGIVDDTVKVNIALMFLTGIALLWWLAGLQIKRKVILGHDKSSSVS